jgi:AraC-like DNA-binding protein
VRFGYASSEIVFAAKHLMLPIQSANPGLDRILVRYMDDLLARLPKSNSFVERARGVVAQTMCRGRPTLERTARDLRASPRTVQRRLAEHGTSHPQVVDSVRRGLAERLVDERRMSITEIAFLLGFADLGGFERTYRRWTGMSPSRARMSRT